MFARLGEGRVLRMFQLGTLAVASPPLGRSLVSRGPLAVREPLVARGPLAVRGPLAARGPLAVESLLGGASLVSRHSRLAMCHRQFPHPHVIVLSWDSLISRRRHRIPGADRGRR